MRARRKKKNKFPGIKVVYFILKRRDKCVEVRSPSTVQRFSSRKSLKSEVNFADLQKRPYGIRK